MSAAECLAFLQTPTAALWFEYCQMIVDLFRRSGRSIAEAETYLASMVPAVANEPEIACRVMRVGLHLARRRRCREFIAEGQYGSAERILHMYLV